MAGRNAQAAATGLQEFIDALISSMDRASAAKSEQSRHDERMKLEREQFEDLKRHRKAIEEGYGGRGQGSSTGREREIRTLLFGEWDRGGSGDPDEMFRKLQKRNAVPVRSLPYALRASAFKGKKPEEDVEVTDADVSDAYAAIATGTDLGDMDPPTARRQLEDFLKTNRTYAAKLGISGPEELGNWANRYRPEWEKQAAQTPKAPPPTGSRPAPITESGEPTGPQQPWGGGSPVVQSRDGNVMDHVSDLLAKRLSRDPQTSVMAGHELRKLGYQSVPSPFDMMDQQGNPSPELLQAATMDPQLGAMLQQHAQVQQQLQDPAAGLQKPKPSSASKPASRPASGGFWGQVQQSEKNLQGQMRR